jgi:hypothetical protein
MKTICSFCNAVIHEGESPDDPVSHGVCKSCYQDILTKYGFNIKKFLNMLEAPVFLVDSNVNVLAANSLAIGTMKKPLARIQGTLGGKLLECVNAFLPEGCGKTPFCPDCPIRASVNETYATGKAISRRPVTLCRKVGDTSGTTPLLISTRKDGNAVLLRFELV